eukprot:GAFH01001293.1.p1 GENE.GAFH01001293.1~~GAFH01001293.1.p1  ORF type:complete len:529 (-),score=155.98 GAFH01001293.1:153-1559(-)
MAEQSAAVAAVEAAKLSPPVIGGRTLRLTYSKSARIHRESEVDATKPETRRPPVVHHDEHSLLITIHNPLYPITTQVLSQILQQYGLRRIVIFHKNGVQALAEFGSADEAEKAKTALDGQQIYQDSCALHITYSKVDHLNVRANNEKTFDYTQNLPAQAAPAPAPTATSAPRRQPAGPSSRRGQAPQNLPLPPMPFMPYGMPYPMPPHGDPMAMHGMPPMGGRPLPYPGRATPRSGAYPPPFMGNMSFMPMPGQGAPTSVLMIYNLDERLTCDHIFNLFCLYGNVMKVKRLPTKAGSAMVQMGDFPMADVARTNLNGAALFGKRLEVQFSRHLTIKDGRESESLAKDFTDNSNNRFLRPSASSFNFRFPPTSVLFFSSAPLSCTEKSMADHFLRLGATAPSQIRFFEQAGKSSRNPERVKNWRNGLLQWASPVAATEALVLCNNTDMGERCTIKLAFSMNKLPFDQSA